MRKPHYLHDAIRRALLAADPHCWYCGRDLDARTATVEHIQPRRRRDYHFHEVQLACEPCNQAKRIRQLSEVSIYFPRGPRDWPRAVQQRHQQEEATMLVLSRRRDEQIVIGNGIVVTVLEIRGDKVRLGFDAPPDVKIMRTEILARPPREAAPGEKPARGWPAAGRTDPDGRQQTILMPTPKAETRF